MRRHDPYHTPCTQYPTHPLQAVSFVSEDFATALEALPDSERAGWISAVLKHLDMSMIDPAYTDLLTELRDAINKRLTSDGW